MMQSLRRSVSQLVSRPIYLFMMLIVPLFGTVFFLTLMKQGLPLQVPVSVVDMDHTSMSRSITRQLTAGPLLSIHSRPTSYHDALRSIRTGRTYGFLYIPRGFQNDAIAGRRPTLSFVSDMSIFIPGTLTYKGFKTTSVTTSGGVITATLLSTPFEATPGLTVPIRLQTHPIGNPWTNYGIYLSQSFLPALLALIIAAMTVFSVLSEIKYSTSPAWIALSGGSMIRALAAKLLPQTVVFTAVGLAMQAVMFGFLSFPLHCPVWRMMLAMVLLVLACQAFGLILAELLPNLRLALIMASLTGILAFSVAGFSFPVDKMYPSIGIFSYILPVRFYFLIYVDQALNGLPLYYSRTYYAALLLFTLVPFIGLGRLKKHCLNPVYVP